MVGFLILSERPAFPSGTAEAGLAAPVTSVAAAQPTGATEPVEFGDDQEVMAAVREGNASAFRTLVERYWTVLVSYACGFMDSGDEAEDVVQQTFIQVWKHREQWTPTGTVGGYLYRVTRNLAANVRRQSQARRRREQTSADVFSFPVSSPSPLAEFETERLRRQVEAAIAELPERRREIFVLSRYHRLTHRKIAETLGISQQTVSNQMTRALADLRHALDHVLRDA